MSISPAQSFQSFDFESDDSLHIFLLRGLTRESGHWGEDFSNNLQQKFPNAEITYLDLPGAGIYYEEKAPMSVPKIMEFMRERNLEEIESSRGENIIVATSLGGMVAMEWVKEHPQDFQGIVMICSAFKYICDLDERAQKQVRRDMIRVMFQRDLEKRETTLLEINSNDSNNFKENLESWIHIQEDQPMSKANILRQTIAGMRYGIQDFVPQIPLLIIGSKADRMVCTTCIEKVHDEFGGELAWNENSGHGVPIDAPEWLVDTFKEWVDSKSESKIILSSK